MGAESFEKKYGHVCDKLWGCFPVKMKLHSSLHSELDAKETKYDYRSEDFESPEFWMNTQFLIYQICEAEESLMGILFNKLKKKISLHFECEVSADDKVDMRYDAENKSLYIKVFYNSNKCFDDSVINYIDYDYTKLNCIESLVRLGYDKAKDDSFKAYKAQINKLKDYISDVIKQIVDIIKNKYFDALLEGEEEKDFKHLFQVALAYSFPTKKFPAKKFSALTANFYRQNKEELSCGGEFLIWRPDVAMGSILSFLEDGTKQDSLFLLQFVKLQNEILLKGSQETMSQMTGFIKKESVKSAKAAIMSRNMSHNLGSHVMAYLKHHLSSVTTMLNDNVLTRLCGEDVDYEKLLDYLENNVSGFKVNDLSLPVDSTSFDRISSRLALPFLVGLGQFVSYLQERQDFIATISTDYIPYYSTVNFKDSVYDELNPDKRYERHKDRQNLQLDNILLGNIARSEGLGRPTSPTKLDEGKLCDIVLRYKDFDGNPCKEGTDEYSSLEELRQLNVSLPGGIVGRQAIFSIVENVIRNAAKHGSWRDTGKLELTFNKYDISVDEIPNDDNIQGHKSLKQVIDTYYLPAEDINDLYIITITDNTKCSIDSLQKLRIALNDEYVNSSGVMNSANKGLKEMRISAAWLRSIKDESICVDPALQGHDDADFIKKNGLIAPIIYARIATDDRWGVHLQYIFCLPKPKVLAVVSDDLAEKCRETRIEGCRFFAENEFSIESNKSYEFILCENGSYDHVRPYASARTFTLAQSGVSHEELLALKDKDSLKALLDRLYEKLFGYEQGDVINIDDKKAVNNLMLHYEDSKGSSLPIEKITVVEDAQNADGVTTYMSGDSFVAGLSLGTYLKRGGVLFSDGKICGKYIYRTHHDSYDQFVKYMDANNDAEFVEGITGNNSTDRLIRNEDIDGPWFYRHLHAMKMNVAICDERLFSKITGLEETDFTREKIRLATNENLSETKKYYVEISPDNASVIKLFDNADKLNNFVSSKSLRKDLQVTKAFSKGITAASNVQRRVFVYTFIQDAECPSKYFLIGVSMQGRKPVFRDPDNHNYECLCARLAELTWSEDDGLHMNYLNGGGYCENFFDYVTIHQGLLDKLYEAFDIKNVPESQEKLTNKLYTHFCKQSVQKIISIQVDTPEKAVSLDFLSGMMVHSGRSKPGVHDMPQALPFIQYAALEHAIMDCKYSLVELLDHARYEL